MNKLLTILLFVIAIFLVLNGLINIVDNGRILAYDITSILSGFGFMITGLVLKQSK